MSNITSHKPSLIATSSALIIGASNAALLRITVEVPSNVERASALVSFRDGSNDFFDTGSNATAGLDFPTEGGDTSVIQASLAPGNNLTIAHRKPLFPG